MESIIGFTIPKITKKQKINANYISINDFTSFNNGVVVILLDGNHSKNDEKNFRKIKYKIKIIIVCVWQKKLLK